MSFELNKNSFLTQIYQMVLLALKRCCQYALQMSFIPTEEKIIFPLENLSIIFLFLDE